jgi:translation initiation factor IF-1
VKRNIRRRRRNQHSESRKEDFIYFENGLVTESLPGTAFRVKIERKAEAGSELDPIVLVCSLKTKLIKRRILIIKGDTVVVEVNPADMYQDEENNILKGIIVERK